MFRINIKNLDISQIADSGQAFRFKRVNAISDEAIAYELIAFGKFLRISQTGDALTLSCSEEEWNSIWSAYFDTATDYAAIGALIEGSGDDYLIGCYRNGRGVRILRQELWEIIVTFIISQNNNIKRITASVDKLCQRYGRPIDAGDGLERYAFPGYNDVPDDAWDDATLGLGYRNEYLRELFKKTAQNPDWISELSVMDYNTAMDTLLAIKGIGKKVANCICLFGLHHVAAFPVDTHVKQILSAHYPEGFDFNRYEGIAGIVQQYMFYNKITTP